MIALALAFVGGAASYIHRTMNGQKFVLARLFGTVFVSGFVGITTYYLVLALGIPEGSPFTFASSSISGALGYDAVRPHWERFLSRIK